MENKRYTACVLSQRPEYFDADIKPCECGSGSKRVVFKQRWMNATHVSWEWYFYCAECGKTVYKYIK